MVDAVSEGFAPVEEYSAKPEDAVSNGVEAEVSTPQADQTVPEPEAAEPTGDDAVVSDNAYPAEDAATAGEAEHEPLPETSEAEVTVAEEKGPVRPTKLYFVRYPKPDLSDLDIETEKVKAVFQSFKEGCNMLLATIKVQRVHENEAKREFEAAVDVFGASAAEEKKWRDELEPFRNADRIVSDRRNRMRDNVKELPARSEAELDAKIAEAEFNLGHVTMSHQAEDKIIREISRLKKNRPEVKRIEAEYVAVESSKDQLVEFASSKKELENKVTIIKEEVKQAKQVRQERWDALREIRDKTNALSAEHKVMHAQKDEKWAELNKYRDARKKKLDVFYENRRFSQKVRQLLASGETQDAIDRCAAVNDKVIGKLISDAEFRNEYTALWELQRKYAVSQASIDLDPVPSAKSGKAKAVTNGKVDGKDRAAEIIKAMMLEADQELGKAPAPVTTAARSSMMTSTAKPDSAMTNGATESTKRPTPAKTERSALKVKAAPAPKPVKEIDDFEIPSSFQKTADEGKPSAAELKAIVKEDQRKKAAAADEKKRHKEEAKKKKAQKSSEGLLAKQAAEQQRQEDEAALVKRNADAQRQAAARKKAADLKKSEKQAAGVTSRMATHARVAPSMKTRPLKMTSFEKLQKLVKDNQTYVAGCAAVGSLALVIATCSAIGGV